jgi:hypothetical protein
VDPTATGVPANHYVIDLIAGDVSRNLLVYQAWQRGEMPWWDPYTDGGRPLAAEAHAVNVTDPFKIILFRLLPFELAYNWTRIVTFLVSGLTAFLLLRHFRFSAGACIWGGLLYEFAGANAMMFSGPTVQAAFSYVPLLWLLWDKAVTERRFFWFVVSSFVTALSFLSGNLQSHSYAFLFGFCFLVGYGLTRRAPFFKLAGGIALALTLGLCLSAPFVLSQVELFLLSIRTVEGAKPSLGMASGVLSVATFFPWLLGTFRTLDVGKIIGQNSLGFWPYIGSAALVIALLGASIRRPPGSHARAIQWTALALVATYLVICSTPLLKLFYTRTAWLAVLGLVVFFAAGWERLMAMPTPEKKWGIRVLALALLVAAVTNIGGLVVYPRFQDRIEAFVLKKQATNTTLEEANDLRKFQVANFPREITFRNREPLVSFLGLVAVGIFLLRPPATRRGGWLCAILVLSSLPLLWFMHRYVPQHPIALWEKFRAGGPEQQRVVDAVKACGLRLREIVAGGHDYVFPGANAQIFGVHVLQGHSSLKLRHAGLMTDDAGAPDPQYHDVLYRSPTVGLERGDMTLREGIGLSRYRWAGATMRQVEIAAETLNTITLTIGPGPAGELIRTDTHYPGWRVSAETPGATLRAEPPCFARLSVPAGMTRLKLVYEPRWLRPGIWIAAGGGILILGLLLAFRPASAGQRGEPVATRT